MSDSLKDIVGERLEGEEHTTTGQLEGEAELNSGFDDGDTGDTEQKGAEPEATGEPGASEEEGQSATPAPEPKEPTSDGDDFPVPKKALIDERRKRQELQRQLDELNGKLSVYQDQTKKPHEPQGPKAPVDPDAEFFELGPAKYFEKQREAFTRAQAELERKMEQAATTQRITMSETLVRSQFDDFDDVVDGFVDVASKNPHVHQQFLQQANPAKFAYDYMKLHKQVQGVGSIEDLRNRIREEERARIQEELRRDAVKADAERVSTSSAAAQSVGSARVAVGDIPLSEILK